MKATVAFLALAASGSLAAVPGDLHHRHNHRHAHPKRAEVATKIVTVEGPTVTAYELDGELLSQDEACEGIEEGSYVWADGKTRDVCGGPSPPAGGGQFFEQPSSSEPEPEPTHAPPPSSVKESSTPTPESPEGAGIIDDIIPDLGGGGGTGGGEGLDTDFPDGEISCSEFPSSYGPISLDYLGFGGWSGIQYVTRSGGFFSAIHTAIEGDDCRDGAMCSYACPPGYQKSQWPETQGSTGQSVGGLSCSGGKLHLTNPGLSKKLCIPGTGAVQVKNTMDEVVAVCRTDYPGTESEVVPLASRPGSTDPLTCPDAGKYYSWQGSDTSAQYYVNPKGVPVEKGCQWGDGTENIGNFAPINLGAGTNNGATFISIFQNKPTTYEKLDFNIEIKGDNLSGSCKYENGQFISGSGPSPDGCTVEVLSGTATYVFSQ